MKLKIMLLTECKMDTGKSDFESGPPIEIILLRFTYKVETTEAVMIICGEVIVKLKEIYQEDLQEDIYWTQMAEKWLSTIENYTELKPEDNSIAYYFYRNRESFY